MEGVSPLKREALSKLDYAAKKNLEAATAAGVNPEQIEAMQDQILAAREAEGIPDCPVLWPGLMPVWQGWIEHGPVCSVRVRLGVSAAVYEAEDHSHQWAVARLSWLDEEGYTNPEERRVMRRLWREMDREMLLISTEQARAATERANQKAG